MHPVWRTSSGCTFVPMKKCTWLPKRVASESTNAVKLPAQLSSRPLHTSNLKETSIRRVRLPNVDYAKFITRSRRRFHTGTASTESWGNRKDITQALLGCGVLLGVGYIAFSWYVKRSGLSWKSKECLVRANILEKEGDIQAAKRKLLEAFSLTVKDFGLVSLSTVLMADKVAQFCHKHGDLKMAKEYYVKLMQCMLQLGYKDSNKGVVGAALSVADISMENDDYETALVGYRWCLERAEVDGLSQSDIQRSMPPTGLSIHFGSGNKAKPSDTIEDELHIICLERLGYCLYEMKASSWPEALGTLEKAKSLRLHQLESLATEGIRSGDYLIRMAVLLESLSTVKTSLEDIKGALEESTRAAELHKLVEVYFKGESGYDNALTADALTADEIAKLSTAIRALTKLLGDSEESMLASKS
ncbi:hypothetical protein SARC_11790 [Sphaeroforma arctica JP610]|uniref:Uncharacterized protein n=1 Tax=Sphaeroforma arctica JP610 TaxID=667725 RepID=A0A0L0FG13_9EUKA|nr:hypothetical protein SARC_11790 [Sphaeroforma arctica JP610]KNC75690.1 hypothetical protein SARC_11790 [Sphaeroforma arctica JP610]|eukprot:XP_014149592.1 hypothetical protein SARC_11790 [Sphaeroforma arctica JP610]